MDDDAKYTRENEISLGFHPLSKLQFKAPRLEARTETVTRGFLSKAEDENGWNVGKEPCPYCGGLQRNMVNWRKPLLRRAAT